MNGEPSKALTTIDGQVVATEPAERKIGMIRPLATPDEALDAWQAFQDLKGKLITQDDVQQIQGRAFVKKGGWRKIAAAFGISTESMAEDREDHGGWWLWRVRVRATAPNGRYCEGTAGCASNERRFSHPEHDVYAQAFTRACNRAISDLVGGGEVSAEEMKAERPQLSRDQASELIAQFERSCDDKGVAFDHRSLAVQLLQSTDDLRRAFKHFRDKGEGEPDEAAPDDE